MKEIGFDIISDLNLNPDSEFEWSNKPSSLYCILAGNVSSDFGTLARVLVQLAEVYRAVFYVPGTTEYETAEDIYVRTKEISELCNHIPNVVLLHQQVVLVDEVAIAGINGWNDAAIIETVEDIYRVASRCEDINYLKGTLKKLQRHLDIKNIVIVSSSVPREDLYYGEEPTIVYDQIPLCHALSLDTEKKTSHWVFGSYPKLVDTQIDGIHYVNNPYKCMHDDYWPKRLVVSV